MYRTRTCRALRAIGTRALNHVAGALLCHTYNRCSPCPELAWTCCDYADMLREPDAEGNRAKAMSLLDESLAVSSELGMRPLTERVLSRREILEA